MNNKNKTKITLGIILIVIAFVALIASEQVYKIMQFKSPDEIRMATDSFKYGGYAAGIIGAILLLVGLLKKSEK